MGGHKKWNRLEEAEDILDHVFEVMTQIPMDDLKRGYNWLPSEEFCTQMIEAKDRVRRYMKRNKLNGWSHHDNEH